MYTHHSALGSSFEWNGTLCGVGSHYTSSHGPDGSGNNWPRGGCPSLDFSNGTITRQGNTSYANDLCPICTSYHFIDGVDWSRSNIFGITRPFGTMVADRAVDAMPLFSNGKFLVGPDSHCTLRGTFVSRPMLDVATLCQPIQFTIAQNHNLVLDWEHTFGRLGKGLLVAQTCHGHHHVVQIQQQTITKSSDDDHETCSQSRRNDES